MPDPLLPVREDPFEVEWALAQWEGLEVWRALQALAREEWAGWQAQQAEIRDREDRALEDGVDPAFHGWLWAGTELPAKRAREDAREYQQLRERLGNAWSWWWSEEEQKLFRGDRKKMRVGGSGDGGGGYGGGGGSSSSSSTTRQ